MTLILTRKEWAIADIPQYCVGVDAAVNGVLQFDPFIWQNNTCQVFHDNHHTNTNTLPFIGIHFSSLSHIYVAATFRAAINRTARWRTLLRTLRVNVLHILVQSYGGNDVVFLPNNSSKTKLKAKLGQWQYLHLRSQLQILWTAGHNYMRRFPRIL